MALKVHMLALTLSLIRVGMLVCQAPPAMFVRHLTQRDGLPSNRVNAIAQDPDGIIWIATSKGLVAYDGTIFFDPLPDSISQVLNSIEFIKLYATPDGTIWAGTAGSGLYQIEYASGRIHHYTHDPENPKTISSNSIQIIFQDPSGSIWVGAGGLNRFLPDQKAFTRFLPYRDTLALNQHHQFQHLFYYACPDPDKKDWMYLAAANGVCHFNYKTLEAEYFFPPPLTAATQSATQGPDGNIWIVTWGTGLYRFSHEDHVFTRFACDARGVSDPTCLNSGGIVPYHDNTFLISVWNGAIVLFNREAESFSPFDLHGISAYTPLASKGIFTDQQQGIWITTMEDGIYYSSALSRTMQRIRIPGNVQDVHAHPKDQHIYACTEEGTVWSLASSGEILEKHHVPSSPPSPHFLDFETAPDQSLWLLSTHDLYQLRPDHSFGLYVSPGWSAARTAFGYFWDMAIDQAGSIWVASQEGGLGQIHPATSDFVIYNRQQEAPNQLLYDYSINVITTGRDGRIYGSGENIFCRDQRNNEIWHFPKVVNTPRGAFQNTSGFAEDTLGYIWMGKTLGNLVKIHRDSVMSHSFHAVQLQPPLPNLPIQSILCDRQGFIWVVTETSLSKINPWNHDMQYYGEAFGLHGLRRMTQASDGLFFLTSDSGLIRFHPDEIPLPVNTALPRITSFRVLDLPVALNGPSTGIRLRHQQNFFSFEFSALDLADPSPKQFAYQLEGVDPEWINAGQRRYVSYAKVDAGFYTFKVRVRNEGGIWSEKEARIDFHIIAPLWKTWWFRSLSLSLLVVILYTAYRYRIRQIQKAEELKTAFHTQMAEVEMNALRAQMNPHFLFNSLNAIKYYVVKKSPEKAAEYLDNFARLIRLILQNSRESRIPLQLELESLQLYIEMERLRFDEQFDFDIRVDLGLDTSYILIPPLLLQPYVENAIWHGLLQRASRGKLSITASRDNGGIRLEIEDNGIGRHKAEELKSKSSQQKKSMGMQLTKARMDIDRLLSQTQTHVDIEDLTDEYGHAAGTRVVITMHHPDTLQPE